MGLSSFSAENDRRDSKDSPDVRLEFSDGDGSIWLGCEVRELHADEGGEGSSMREFQAVWLQIEKALFKGLQHGQAVPNCRVDFETKSYDCLKRVDRRAIERELVLARNRLSGKTATISFPQADMPHLNKLLTKISVVTTGAAGFRWWPSHMQSGEVPLMDSAICKAFEEKKGKADHYDWLSDEIKLLLLVAPAHGLTDVLGRARNVTLPDCEHSFTWIVVWDVFSEDIWALYPEYAVICDGRRQSRRPPSPYPKSSGGSPLGVKIIRQDPFGDSPGGPTSRSEGGGAILFGSQQTLRAGGVRQVLKP